MVQCIIHVSAHGGPAKPSDPCKWPSSERSPMLFNLIVHPRKKSQLPPCGVGRNGIDPDPITAKLMFIDRQV